MPWQMYIIRSNLLVMSRKAVRAVNVDGCSKEKKSQGVGFFDLDTHVTIVVVQGRVPVCHFQPGWGGSSTYI